MRRRGVSHRRHKCAAPFCSTFVPWNFLMCGRHWSMVPPSIQQAVYESWNGGRPNAAHTAAVRCAIDSVPAGRQLSLFEGAA